MTNLSHILLESAWRRPEEIALRLDEAEVSFANLDAASARLAGLLISRGLRQGDRVAVMLPDIPYFAIVYYGVLRAGGVVVPLNVLLNEHEAAFLLSDSAASFVFAWPAIASAAWAGADAVGAECVLVTPGDFEELLAASDPVDDPVARADSDTAVILYTSGTTGTPKGAELTHANLRGNVEVVVDMLGLSESDVVLGALPLFHALGQTAGLNAAVAAGSCLTLIPRFTPEKALKIIERDGVTVFEGVPTMFASMLPKAGQSAAKSLRLCISDGAALPVDVISGFEKIFGCAVLEGYGLSETSPVASFNHPRRQRKPGSIGTPIAGVEMKLITPNDEGIGEIAIRGANVMKGYWNCPDATAAVIDADGWFRTGDLARCDADGYYFIVDRSKDVIIRGGVNVYPREIEEVLYGHPAIHEVAVIGVPDTSLGTEIGAAVVLIAGSQEDARGIREFVRERVPAHQCPRHFWFVDELPKGPGGKILKREIAVPGDVPRACVVGESTHSPTVRNAVRQEMRKR